MITRSIGDGSRWLLDKIVVAIAATGINPNVLTAFGLVVNFWAALLFAEGMFRSGAAAVFLAGFLDFFYGGVARPGKRVPPFGAFSRFPSATFSAHARCAVLRVFLAWT